MSRQTSNKKEPPFDDSFLHRDGRCDSCGDPVPVCDRFCRHGCNSWSSAFGAQHPWAPKNVPPSQYPNQAQAEYDGDWFGITDDGRPRIARG